MKSEELNLHRTIATVKKNIADAEIDLMVLRDQYAAFENQDSGDDSYRRLLKTQALYIERKKIVIELLHLSVEGFESELKNLNAVA